MTAPLRAVARPAGLPGWLEPLLAAVETVRAEDLSRLLPPPGGGRESAVLLLLGESEDGPDVVLIERARELHEHAGQPAFPGGKTEPGDGSAAGTALREAAEETGLVPAGVEVLAELPALWVPSGFVVRPVLAWWRVSSEVYVVDPNEVASVHRVTIAELADPARRLRVRHSSGYVGPAFDVRGLRVWGFTAGLLDALLRLGGWERPWDTGRVVPLDSPSDAPLLDAGGDGAGSP